MHARAKKGTDQIQKRLQTITDQKNFTLLHVTWFQFDLSKKIDLATANDMEATII